MVFVAAILSGISTLPAQTYLILDLKFNAFFSVFPLYLIRLNSNLSKIYEVKFEENCFKLSVLYYRGTWVNFTN